eukprot:2084463-Amphidinium_carterae.2
MALSRRASAHRRQRCCCIERSVCVAWSAKAFWTVSQSTISVVGLAASVSARKAAYASASAAV